MRCVCCPAVPEAASKAHLCCACMRRDTKLCEPSLLLQPRGLCAARPLCCPVQDFIREKDLTLRSYGLKEFTALMFKRVPGLELFAPMVGNIFAQFNAYKQVTVANAHCRAQSVRACSCLPQRVLSTRWMLFTLV